VFVAGCIVFALLLAGCGADTGPQRQPAVCTLHCDPTASAAFIESRLDDDDGDGNPRDEDFPVINDEDDDIADHTWARDRFGTYHLFFHTEGIYAPSQIEHYTTADFRTFYYQGTALRPSSAAWEASGLWAPHIVEYGGTWFMFYAGNEGTGPGSKERIGLATSTDLYTWTRYPVNNCPGTAGNGCVYDCAEGWTTWGNAPGSWNQQCRDPFVIRDDVNGCWLLFATAKSTNGYGVVTVAHSTNLRDWSGAGFINATRRLAGGRGGQPTGGQCENPFVMSHDGTRYLLFTDWQDPEDSLNVQPPRTQVQYATSATLAVDSTGSANWIYRGYTPDPAVNAIEVLQTGDGTWLMSQRIANPLNPYYNRRGALVLKCILWASDGTFTTENVSFSCGG